MGSRGRESERAAAAAAAIEEREREQIVHPSAALSSLASDNRKLSGSPSGTRARKRQRREREQYEQQGEPRVLCLLELAIAGG